MELQQQKGTIQNSLYGIATTKRHNTELITSCNINSDTERGRSLTYPRHVVSGTSTFVVSMCMLLAASVLPFLLLLVFLLY
jgi:hypothetical protein